MKKEGECDALGCTAPVHTVKWCQAHYMRHWASKPVDNVEINKHMTPELMQKIINDIKAGMTLMDGEKKYGYNRGSMSRMFKREMGISIRDWKGTK